MGKQWSWLVTICLLSSSLAFLSVSGDARNEPKPSSYALFQRAMDLQRNGRMADARRFYSDVITHADASIPARLVAIAHANLAATILAETNGDSPKDLLVVEEHLMAAVRLDPSREDFRENLRYFQAHTSGGHNRNRGAVSNSTEGELAAHVRGITRQATYAGGTAVDRILYINLDRSTGRRAAMEQSFAGAPRTSPPLHRLAAIDGETLGATTTSAAAAGPRPHDAFVEEWMRHVHLAGKPQHHANTSRTGAEPAPVHESELEASEPNTLACYLSHILALTTILQLEQENGDNGGDARLFLILEDDAQLTEGWQTSLEAVLRVIPDDFHVLKLLQFCHSSGPSGEATDDGSSLDLDPITAFRGAALLSPQGSFPGLARLGPGVDDGCNLGNAAYLVRGGAARLREVLDALSGVPVRNVDGVFNLAMDDLRFYATLRPLARTRTPVEGGFAGSDRRRSGAANAPAAPDRRCRCTASIVATAAELTGDDGAGGACRLECKEEEGDDNKGGVLEKK